jgi:hypothetical protein
MQIPIPYKPVEGKTYSLFGKNNSTSGYYQLIAELTDQVLEKCKNIETVLQTIQQFSRQKRIIRKIKSATKNESLISFIMHLINEPLSQYTGMVENHLINLSIKKFWDRRLGTTREQYHLHMLEIELTNRMFVNQFTKADHKIALLPHCLRDFNIECKSKADDFDYQCKQCSKNCYENYISRLLKNNQVEPYIWMGADIRKKAKEIYKNKQSLGILGIACIPELVWGMRKCQKYGIAAVGIPLDANRCQRWMGKFYENSVNLEQLEALITNCL